ncbi:hypothetical protein PVAP13_3NG050638 [Panicum virgatum]|uniref:Uncharacterized protein n=1 Tax=Panicum virgatum TaxID=38727 RepID=A0A8T0U550_PANVG|nr:hypothetical protein PVAP13_3NG050638 [Panicum virgatum]
MMQKGSTRRILKEGGERAAPQRPRRLRRRISPGRRWIPPDRRLPATSGGGPDRATPLLEPGAAAGGSRKGRRLPARRGRRLPARRGRRISQLGSCWSGRIPPAGRTPPGAAADLARGGVEAEQPPGSPPAARWTRHTVPDATTAARGSTSVAGRPRCHRGSAGRGCRRRLPWRMARYTRSATA